VFIPILHLARASSWTLEALSPVLAVVAQQWLLFTIVVVVGRVGYLIWRYNLRIAMLWFVKLVTDPLTDLMAYTPRYWSISKALLPSRLRKSEPA
jgi:glutamate-1-semialdehyde 2,1-aminomutase